MTRGSCTTSSRLARADELAVVQHHDALGKRQHHLHQVLDDHDGDAAGGDAADDLQRLVDLGRVEPGVHFIEQEHFGLHRKALRELQALA